MEKLTKEQRQMLQPYEINLMSAREHYLRPAGRVGNEIMHRIYTEMTGEEYRKTDSCGSCELQLQTIVAMWYFGTPIAVDEDTLPENEAEAKTKAKRSK